MKLALFLFLIFLYPAFADDNSYTAIAKRLEPAGIVEVAGEAKHVTQMPIDAALPPRGGNEIFQQYCSVCHGTGVAGAPRFGCRSAWAPRASKGMTTLLNHATHGFKFMPAKGTCMDCSKNELEDAVEYMLDHSSKDDNSC